MTKHVPVAWYCEPFMRRPQQRTMLAGMTLEEIIRAIPREDLPAGFLGGGVATINGEIVPRELWARVRPRSNGPVPVVVNLYPHVEGGGSGGQKKNPWATVAAIAALVATIWIGGGGLQPILGEAFAAGTFLTIATSAAVSVAGSLLVNSLSPPPQLSKNQGDDTQREPASLSGNVLQPDGPIPSVIGQYQIFPPFGCQPLVDLDGEEEVLEATMVLAGPHRWDKILIDDTGIDDMSEIVDYETREGWPDDAALSLITRYARTETPNVRLSEHTVQKNNASKLEDTATPANSLPVDHIITAGDPNMSELWLTLSWPAGFIEIANSATQMVVPVRISVRARGDSTWIDLPEIHFCNNSGQPHQRMVKLIWDQNAPSQPTPATARAPLRVFNRVPAQTASPAGTAKTFHVRFGTPSGTQSQNVYSAANPGSNTITNVALYDNRVEFFMGSSGSANLIPKDILEIKLQRGIAFGNGDYNSTNYAFNGSVYDFFGYYTGDDFLPTVPDPQEALQSMIVVSRVATVYNESPVPIWPVEGRGLAVLAVKIKARNFSKISCLVSKYVQDWSGSAWDNWTADTSNPAPHFVAAIAGPLNLDPVPAALLDDDVLTAWRTRCTTNSRTADGVVDGQSVAQVAAMIASAGYASPRQSERWGVAEDRDRSADDIRQLFSPRNSSNFRWSDPLVKLPDAIRASYRDSSLDYIEQQIVVPEPDLAEVSVQLPSTLSYTMIGTAAKVRERAQFDMLQLLHRSRTYTLETDLEALCCTRGDLVGVQHDVISRWAGFGLISEILLDASNIVTGIILDAEVPTSLLSGATMGAQIRLSDQSMLVKQLVSGVENRSRTLLFASPFADPGTLLKECMVVTGELSSEHRRLLVHGASPGEYPRVTLTLKDEANEIHQPYNDALSAMHVGNFATVQPGSLAAQRAISNIPLGQTGSNRRLVLVVCGGAGDSADNIISIKDSAGNQLDSGSDLLTVRAQYDGGTWGDIRIMDLLIPVGSLADIQFTPVSSFHALAAYILLGGGGGYGNTLSLAGSAIDTTIEAPPGSVLLAGAGNLGGLSVNPTWGADLTDNGRITTTGSGSPPYSAITSASRIIGPVPGGGNETIDVELSHSSSLNLAAAVFT